jgi:hypothetical protein
LGKKRFVLFLFLVVLVGAFLIVGVFLLTAPKQPTSSISNADVLNIGIKYVEETYGTDYARTSDVTETTFSNGTGTGLIQLHPLEYLQISNNQEY